jgi:CPA1 family monovalent cation:H+ antiporter
MLGLVLVVVLGVAVLAGGVAARRLRLAPPVVLLVFGAMLGFIPELRRVELPPEAVLLLFLPALLYWESLTTSLREIRSNLRSIVMASTILVVATAAVVAIVAHNFGLEWGPAWVLGAALAPTDATAVAVLARALPRRTLTVLRAESLVNDGTALVVYGLAVGVTVGAEHLSPLHVSGLALIAYGGGALAGALIAVVATRAFQLLDNPLHENLLLLVTPFAAYLLAESVEASGVLAVVVCGLIISQVGPRIGRADSRQQLIAFWSLATYVLNGSLFVLVGLQLQAAIRGLTSATLSRGLVAVVVVSAAVIGMRFLWMFTVPYIVRALDRRPQQRLRRVGARPRVVSAVSGFRGAVSLAAALAVPEALDNGAPFPDRDLIIFVTSGVIVVTLAQALVLPKVLRWAHLAPDGSEERELRFAQLRMSEAAFAAIQEVADRLGTDAEVVDRVVREYEEHMQVVRATAGDGSMTAQGLGAEEDPVLRHDRDYSALRLALIGRKRATVVALRDQQLIDDTVLRQIESRLDIEEVRLARRQLVE